MKLDKITTIFLDIDGTLTDGKVYLDNGKNEFKSFDVKDGLMVVSTIELGYENNNYDRKTISGCCKKS
jgi:3-deoxy-D-manno-octulosonate 8-phosphate phosphatase (KDO 8-P phosphatase)